MRRLPNKLKEVVPKIEEAKGSDISSDLLAVVSETIKLNQERVDDLIRIDKDIISILKEVSKPKEKKAYVHTIGRDKSGRIEYVETKEQ